MHSVHIEFITMVESELFKEISNMGVSEERFIALLDASLQQGDETVERLYKELVVYRNFVDFGLMMQQKYNELYPSPSPTISSSPNPTLTSTISICRVLWDLENVQVNPRLGGIKTVMQLQDFLKRNNMMGAGIDTRITAFLNPFNKNISKKVIEELNKASVELVCASSKREDADRKLGIRINQEMQLLNPALTTFVIISSDQDFRQHMQLMANAGYKVVIIHDAKHESWRNTLEMHASMSFEWGQVVTAPSDDTAESPQQESRDPSPAPPIATTSTTAVPSASSSQAKLQTQETSTTAGGARSGRDQVKEALAVGWRIAVCQRWSSAFGFLMVDVLHPPLSADFVLTSPQELHQSHMRINKKTPTADGGHIINDSIVRVYVHSSALTHKPQASRILKAGEHVLAHIEVDPKGPKAIVVKELFTTQS